jgi:hypothetical protein
MEPGKGTFERIQKTPSARLGVSQQRTSLSWRFARPGRDSNTEVPLEDR